jgi:hypothetical protein
LKANIFPIFFFSFFLSFLHYIVFCSVLNLPFDSLTKEIKLTQQLMELFIEYQIPPDLLSYDSNTDLSTSTETTSGTETKVSFGSTNTSSSASASTAISAVKQHVKEIYSILNEKQDDEIEQQLKERVSRDLQGQQSFGGGGGGMFGGGVGNAGGFGGEMSSGGFGGGGNSGGGGFGSTGNTGGFGGGGAAGFGNGNNMQKRSKGRNGNNMRMRKSGGAPPPSAPMAMAQSAPPPPVQQMRSQAAPQVLETKSSSNTSQSDQTIQNNANSTDAADWTNIPKRMDESFEKLDTDSALRPTIMKVDTVWQRTTQKGLLSRPICDKTFNIDKQKTEKQKTFDLLDALTRSGVMAFETGASLHVVLCATHCFDKGIMNTLVQNNINPIEKVERSSLIMASTIHRIPPIEMVKPERLSEVKKWSPMLFDESDALEDDA